MTGHRKTSSTIDERYACKYSNPRKHSKKTEWGVKLVVDNGENFYSIATGLYRYKPGRVKRRGQDWHKLYRGTGYYCEDMVDRIAIFNSSVDLKKFYPDWDTSGYCILLIKLGGDIISIDAKNKHHSCRVFAGKEIIQMERRDG